MSNYDSLVKYRYAAASLLPKLNIAYYFDDLCKRLYSSSVDTISSVYDIVSSYNSAYFEENMIQLDIVNFLNLKDKHPHEFIKNIMNIKRYLAEPTNANWNIVITDDVITREVQHLENKLVFTNITHVSNIHVEELESEIYILTLQKCFPLFFTDYSRHESDIDITYMKYKSMIKYNIRTKRTSSLIHYRKSTYDTHTPRLEVEFKLEGKICTCTSYNYLTKLKFQGNWSLDHQKEILDLFRRFNITACTKRNIKFEYIPKPKVEKSKFRVLRDIIFSGNLSHYIHTVELDRVLEKNIKDSFIMGGRRYNIVKPDIVIFFKSTDYHSSSTEVNHSAYVLEQLVCEFANKYEEIENYYETYTKPIPVKKLEKVKITKLIVEKLREYEPEIFGAQYTQNCQKGKQVYVVDSVEDFIEKLEEGLKKIPDGPQTVDEYIQIYRKKLKRPTLNINHFLTDFPVEAEDLAFWSDMPVRTYACVPRIGNDFEHPFPGSQRKKSTSAPCCFNKPQKRTRRIVNPIHQLSFPKPIPPNRRGFLPPYISSLLNEKKWYRFGVEKLSLLLEMLSADKTITTLINSIKPLTDEYTCDFFYDSLITNKCNAETVYIWSFIIQRKIMFYVLDEIYNSVLVKVMPWFTDHTFLSYCLIGKNSQDTFEVIRTEEKIQHTKSSVLSKYLEFYQTSIHQERLAVPMY